ncbi:HAD family hydrolase [Corynebacterium sp. 13CS0277]|uniref:HAD family hydrolase n=1 Tax=Corynebacterium sp. 13CS0277 TaxID=2071994 RepID=UPI000D030EFF|nr:HAD family hydrolase [Corynebacterium sp. 13CS0277]PRQ11882.1 HAD family hydrolase [Corynebacterium sp. 13CS0277]
MIAPGDRGHLPLLVASDIDGTLITSQERISARTRAVIRRMTRVGTVLALATGRPPRWIYPILEQLDVRPICVCANGAILYDSAADRIFAAHTLAPEHLRTLATTARAAFADHGGVGFAVERAGRSAFDDAATLFAAAPDYDHAWDSVDHGTQPEEELFATPAIKLLLRSTTLNSADMYDIIAPAIPDTLAHVTYSFPDGLVEIAAPGVTKELGVKELSRLIGADRTDVVCFGDMPNDTEMLTWAGWGVAMGNAPDCVKAIANEVTTTNDADGVARVLERWFPAPDATPGAPHS